MPKNLIIIGAGGAGQEALLVARRLSGDWTPVAIVDDNAALHGTFIDGLPVTGGLEACVRKHGPTQLWFHCAVGDNSARLRIVQQALALGLPSATLVDPSVVCGPDVVVGEGTYIGPHGFIGPAAHIGAFCLINVCVSIGHHAELGDFSQVCPGGRLSGYCRLGETAIVASNAVLGPGVRVGIGATLGAASFALKDVPDGTTAVGNPARVVLR
jgi:sugar O-acyltransferase (sialic acid O-acetyltransferase NeuD family)